MQSSLKYVKTNRICPGWKGQKKGNVNKKMIAARLKLNRDYNGRPCQEFIELGPSSSQHLTKWFSALQIQFTYLIIFLLELILPTSRRIWYVKVLQKSKRCSPVHTHKNVLSYGYLVCGLSSHTLCTLVFVPQPKIQIIITILSLTTYLAILSLMPLKGPMIQMRDEKFNSVTHTVGP